MPAASSVRVLLALLATVALAAVTAGSDKPNVLLVISDDQGYGDFGFTGNSFASTPRLDALAAESAVFKNFVAAPACSPSRAAIWTGRDHLVTGVWGVPPRANLRRDEARMPAFFKCAGYRTMHIGKPDSVRVHELEPWHLGWDDAITVAGGYEHRDPLLVRREGAAREAGWTADLWTDEAIRFMRAQRDPPWFLSLAHIIPHMPWVCDEKYSAPFRRRGCSESLAACYGSIAHLDECVGRLLDALHESGQEGRTIVVFVSDNGQTGPEAAQAADGGHVRGPDWDKRNVAGLRGHKATVWENGIRVPLLVRWPGVIEPGERAQFGCVEDILPTLLDLAGVGARETIHHSFTGVSLRPALADAARTFDRPDAFRMTIWGPGMPHAPKGIVENPAALEFEDHHLALRGPRFKYHALPGGRSALYDIEADPGETRDVQGMHPAVAAQMARECRRRWEATIASGRAFGMPVVMVGAEADRPPPNHRSVLRCTAAQALAGQVRIGREAVGFAREGDSATYALEVATLGRYRLVLSGDDLGGCAPLRLDIGDKVLPPRSVTNTVIDFGEIELGLGKASLRIVAGAAGREAKPAKARTITFTPAGGGGAEARPGAMGLPRGLTAGPNATVLLAGKPFRGIGVNYFDCFLRTLRDGGDSSYDAGFAALAARGIPFVRFCATGFWPGEMSLYVEDRDEYFRRLDGVVRTAERHGLGLVPSMFWTSFCVPDLVGEPLDQWANPESRTRAWMQRYVEDVVTRYRESPAIWMWELGNEYSLGADLPNADQHRPPVRPHLGTAGARSERDDMTFALAREIYRAFAVEVRRRDPDRLIGTGDSLLRLSAWHQRHERSWTHDTLAQFAAMLAFVNPEPIDVVSVHAYEEDVPRLVASLEASRRINRPLFVGEFGARGETPEQAAAFRRLLAAIVENEIPLAALWVFDLARQGDFNVTATNARAWQFEAIAEANRTLAGWR
jgi:arylsulfatase A-like enzyme